jgi:hypothetical protein
MRACKFCYGRGPIPLTEEDFISKTSASIKMVSKSIFITRVSIIDLRALDAINKEVLRPVLLPKIIEEIDNFSIMKAVTDYLAEK